MDHRAEARDFLSSRRARITPEQAGVETFGSRRRVTGLRREEVARLAGVSIDYYTRLERGNLQGVSDTVLDAIAGARTTGTSLRSSGSSRSGATTFGSSGRPTTSDGTTPA